MLKSIKACQGKGTGKADTDRYQVFPGQFQRAYIADGGNRDESPPSTMKPPPTKIAAISPRAAMTRNRRAGGGFQVLARAPVREGLKRARNRPDLSIRDHHLYKAPPYIIIKGAFCASHRAQSFMMPQ